uniref:Uncharacterized protein n=1 Tax=Tanacetum cinerariifolium TaxID=118510 RepID=A0A699I2E4_TANCI|nr:hypothetical protein [Tanacetum cinerariifolium]
MKSAGKWNVPTFMKTSSATPTGREIKRSASSRVIQVGDSSRRESLFQTDNGMRFMLAPRSAKAKHSSIPEKSHGMRNLPGSPSFFGFEALTGATTGSEFSIGVSIWTTEGWTSLVLSLLVGVTVSFVTSVSRSTTLGREEVVGIVGSLICSSTSSGDTLQIFLQSQLAVEESGLDEPELGNPGLDKQVLDKLEAGFDHD